MARIDIQGGLERDEIYDKNGNLVGVAEYDLNDVSVRLRVLEFAHDLEDRVQDFGTKYEAMPNETLEESIAKVGFEEEFAKQLFADTDDVFGVNFCTKAIGANSLNYWTLLEILEGITNQYGAQANLQMNKFVKDTRNREQRRLAGKQK